MEAVRWTGAWVDGAWVDGGRVHDPVEPVATGQPAFSTKRTTSPTGVLPVTMDTGAPERRTSNRVNAVTPQQIRTLYDLSLAHDAPDLVHLEFGEPDFETPAHVVDAAVQAARDGKTKYTANAGIVELRREIARWVAETTGVTVDPGSEVVVTTGGVEALFLAILSVADPGEEIVVPTPAWPNTISQATLAGATPIEVPLPEANGFDLEPERVIDAITADTAAVVLTSPSNPTGRVFDVDAMEHVVEAAARHGAYVIADEVYRELSYGPAQPSLRERTAHPEHVLTVKSFSKTYAMTGWRVGWLYGPADVVSQMTKIRESTTSCVSTPSQYAAIAALTGPQEPVREMKAAFAERREYVLGRIDALPRVSCPPPDGAFYVFLDAGALDGSSMDLAKRLLYEYDVVTAPGSAFGAAGEGYLRLSFANGLDRLEAGLDRIERLVRDELDG